jgi:sugar lactone lactonase YvrE
MFRKSHLFWFYSLLILLGRQVVVAPQPTTHAAPGDYIIYGDSVTPGWTVSTASSLFDPNYTAQTAAGSAAIQIGLRNIEMVGFSTSTLFSTAGYSGIAFSVYTPAGLSAPLKIMLSTPSGAAPPAPAVNTPWLYFSTPSANTWHHIYIPLSEFPINGGIYGIWLGDGNDSDFLLDEVRLLAKDPAVPERTADRVLGQNGFTNNAATGGANGLFEPSGVAVAPNGRVFVADWRHSRVLSWPNAVALTNNQAADLVIGQSNLTTLGNDPEAGSCYGGQTTSATSLCGPESVAVDVNGNLYVADSYNHRVLLYQPPFSNGKAASRVLGQNDFSGKYANAAGVAARSSLYYPRGLAIAPNGTLYVADEFNNRVLAFLNPWDANLTAAQTADFVVGQPNFSSKRPNDPTGPLTIADSMGTRTGHNLWTPTSVAVDAIGNLYVVDRDNYRVLKFAPVTSNYPMATFVFGQPTWDFTAGPTHNPLANYGTIVPDFSAYAPAATPNNNNLFVPLDLAISPSGELYIADSFSNRVLVYPNASFWSKPAGAAAASYIYGQTAFNTNTAATTALGLSRPMGLAFDGAGNLLLADSKNNRILQFFHPNTQTLTPLGGQVAMPNGLLLDFPNGAVVNDVAIHFIPQTQVQQPLAAGLLAAQSFRLEAYTDTGTPLTTFASPYTLTLDYNPTAVFNSGITEDTLNLQYYDGNTWVNSLPCVSCSLDTTNHRLTVVLDHFTEFALVGTQAINLQVDTQIPLHAISPYIYGVQTTTTAFASEIKLPIRRWGGNNSSRYNWQIGSLGATNLANDWYFENAPMHDPLTNQDISADGWVAENTALGSQSILTIPMIGYVAESANKTDCGFSTTIYPGQDNIDVWAPCGNGKIGGVNISGNNPLNTSIAVDQAFTTTWVEHLVNTHGNAANGGVQFYNLDNEPELWHETHRDVHPSPLTYDELVNKTIAHAAALKAVDPTAQTLGYASYGWTGYWYSPADTAWRQANGWAWPAPEYSAHGNTYLVEWYLQQLHNYELQNNLRLLDYLDFHFYPQGGTTLTTAGDAARQALRMRSTRALWDPTYVDESWIGNAGPDGGVIKLIPRMQDWIANNYPGTKIAISEYNLGGTEHINGAVAQADALGIFARTGVDLAILFPSYAEDISNKPVGYALRMYRNYDGAGAQFGDSYRQSVSTDESKLAVYSALKPDGTLTVMVINKDFSDITAPLNLIATPNTFNLAKVYQYAGNALTQIVPLPDKTVSGNSFTHSYPAQSITLFEMSPNTATATRTNTATVTRTNTATVTRTNTATVPRQRAWQQAPPQPARIPRQRAPPQPAPTPQR